MHLKNLNIDEFSEFANNHPLASFYQTINYALLKAENSYDYDLIGLVNEDNIILAASLILLKHIGSKYLYGYAPRGFLIDYHNNELLQTFTIKLKEYYQSKNVIFIKVNPNVIIGEVNRNTLNTIYNDNESLKRTLINNGFKKLADNMYFEATLPRFNAIIDLKEYTPFVKNTNNKIKKGMRKGLKFEHANINDLPRFYNLVKEQINHDEYYYHDYYTVFDKEDAIDLFLVNIDYNEFLQNSQIAYDEELQRNTKYNEKIIKYNSEKNINAKLNSDRVLLSYKNDILEASKGITDRKNDTIAGALVIKHNDTASIIISAYDHNYKRFAPNYFLHYNIIKYYEDNYNYLDLNGVVGDFKNPNAYSGLNQFKFGFNPHIYEYLGEYDFIINSKVYDNLLASGKIQKEFAKK